MKFLSITAITLTVLASFVQLGDASGVNTPSYGDLYACALYPMCDKDITSPVVKPKDVKTETQDAKDEKVA
jgi:hypothetical protein